MGELDLVQILEAATAQIVLLVGQVIAISFAMIVAIYYFLNRAGLGLKLVAFAVYSIGLLMYLLLAVRESNIIVAADAMLAGLGAEKLSLLSRTMVEFSDSWVSLILNGAINASFWALWIGVFYLLFIWKRRDDR